MKRLIPVLFLLSAAWVNADVVVVANKANGSTLTKDDVERIFLGKKSSFPDGGKATPYYLVAGDPVRESFDQVALGKSSTQLKSYWSKLVFTGKGTPPEELSSADVLARVASDSSAVAYVDSAQVNDSVKVVFSF